MTANHVFSLLCIAWIVSETWLGWRKRSGDAARTRDGGTLRILLVVIYACIALAVWLATTGIARFPQAAQPVTVWSGLALMAAGLVFRWWAVRVLAQWFTVDVAIRPGQLVVRSGPYARLRHPSYTNALATFYGFGLALGNWPSLAMIAIPVTLTFLWRIRIEERVLAQAFPNAYPAYARETWRLLPGIW